MFFKSFTSAIKSKSFSVIYANKVYKSDYKYEMPEVLKNTFFLANSSFFNNTNWFVHRAYEVAFTDLVEEVKTREPSFDTVKAIERVLSFIKVLEPCNVVIDLRYPVERENGEYSVIRAFRAQHGKFRAGVPCLGGLTINSEVCKDTMKALAALATYRYACLGIDMNGSHGGIKIYKPDYTEMELKNTVQKYILELINRGAFGETLDIIEPDMSIDHKEISWISEVNAKLSDGSNVNGSIVGKPSFTGGLENYEKAGAHCIHHGINFFLNHKHILQKIQCGPGLQNKTFIIQGLGKLGSQVAAVLESAGIKCVGVKEHDAYVYDKNGISVKDIVEYRNKKGGIEHFSTKTKPRQDNEILTEECDLLVLCATHKTLSCYTAEKVKAKVVVEAAQGAITPSAHQILIGHHKLVLPDILITCGFSLASHFEFLKNAQFASNILSRSLTKDVFKDLLYNVQSKGRARVAGQTEITGDTSAWNESKMVFEAMEYIMDQTARDILKKTEKYSLGIDIRTAAYAKSIENLFRIIYDSKSCNFGK